MSVLTMVLLLLAGVSVVLTAVTQLAAHLVLRRRRPRVPEAVLPPISVLKPMKGLDEGLEENLRALASQDYPRFEIVCGTRDPNDPALCVARRVAADFPHVVRVVSGPGVLALNPKVSNLIERSRHARFGTRLISDSNVRPRPGYLRAMASELVQPGVGLVHSVLVGTGERSLGALFENLHFNAWVAQAVSGADVLAGHACVIGKSILYRHGDLQALGGQEGLPARGLLESDPAPLLGDRGRHLRRSGGGGGARGLPGPPLRGGARAHDALNAASSAGRRGRADSLLLTGPRV